MVEFSNPGWLKNPAWIWYAKLTFGKSSFSRVLEMGGFPGQGCVFGRKVCLCIGSREHVLFWWILPSGQIHHLELDYRFGVWRKWGGGAVCSFLGYLAKWGLG